jgi:leader peptidase (prepilin peptidase)/N-methyltransferase
MVSWISLVFVVWTGLSVGSFLNVVIDRLPEGHSLVNPPSHCPHCGRRVASLDLVPLLNYLWLRGRCRYCRARIPARIPLVEAATGALFAYVVFQHGFTLAALSVLVSGSVFIVVAVMDLETHRILNKVTLPAVVVVMLLYPFGFGSDAPIWESYLLSLGGGAAGFFSLLALFVVANLAGSDFGAGDVKLGALVGVATGLPDVATSLMLAFIVSGVVAVFLVAALRMSRKHIIPFGPYLAGAALLTLLADGALWRWYWGVLT